MKRYNAVHAVVHGAIAGLLYLFLRYVAVIDKFEYADYIRAGALLLLPFLFNRSTFIAEMLIEKIPGVSTAIRKMLSGNDFVEGDWPLVVMSEDRRTPRYLGFLTIKYEQGQLLVSGDDWLPDGTHAVSFRSQQSQYAERKLQYWYAQGSTLHAPDMFGYTRIYFFPDRGPIGRLAGEFLDKQHFSPPFYATRMRYRPMQRRLATSEQKLAAARALWAEIEPRVEAMASRRIEQDFA